MLDLRTADVAAKINRGEGADVGVLDEGALANDGRASNQRSLDDSPLLDNHVADELGLGVDISMIAGLGALQDDPVGVEHVLELAGVLPPSFDQVRQHLAALINQPLNRVGDLELASI